MIVPDTEVNLVMGDSRIAGNVSGLRDDIKLEKDHYVFFDTLPQKVREEIANAPYPMAVEDIAEWVNRCRLTGMGELEIIELALYRFRAFISRRTREECLRLYGPGHPQAGP